MEARADAEDVHSFHRLYWVSRYAVAAAFGHERAQEALLQQLPEWLDGRWKNSSIACWPYTVAERIASLTTTLFWIHRGAVSRLEPLIAPVKQQVWRDAVRLSSNMEFGLGVHNHLLNDARGLFLASAALSSEWEQSEEWRAQALAIWDEYFPKLVLNDGTFAEQSSHYHLLLCRTALEYWLGCRRAGRAVPSGFEIRLRSMFDLANELLRADGSLPRFGDISPDCEVSDLWGMLAAAYHYGLLDRAPRHALSTPLTVFYCGHSTAIPQAGGPANDPSAGVCFPSGGFAFLRSSSLNAELVAHGDGRNSVGAHGDAGRGSYELWWNGARAGARTRKLLQLFGRYAGAPISAPDSQNVTSLDGLSPVITKPDERYGTQWYRPEGGAWEMLADGGIRFRVPGIQPSPRRYHAVAHLALCVQPDTFVFEEKIEGSSRVQFESRICLGDADWGPIERSRHGERRREAAMAAAKTEPSAEMNVQSPEWRRRWRTRPCTFLQEYGVEKQGRLLLLSGYQQLPFAWTAQWRLRKAA